MMASRMEWQPIASGYHWDSPHLTFVHIKEDLLRTGNDYDPGCEVQLADGVRLCRLVPAAPASDKGLDFPDSPGWWAYWYQDEKRIFRFDVMSQRDNIIIYGSNDNNDGLLHRFASEFKREYPGKWYRLHMPWDTQEEA